MILPVTAYGHPTLRKVAADIDREYEGLDQLIADMYETMYHTVGVGLAAPQVNRSIRLFIVDASPYAEDQPELKDFKKVFINAQITERSGEPFYFNEGCLSVPDIHEDVERPSVITITYYDREWNFHEETYDGIAARIIQHEYDHLEGILFVDRLSSLRKTLLRKRLLDIASGNIKARYKMIFPNLKKRRKR
ncbi:MAG: peptide deformylase [Bacteroidetes bacterium]|nr:MAG: peptide deformylase [Bacteroidota bacterium]